MNGTLGMILLLAGICQGSFGLGYKDYRPFGWALFWQIYNLLCLFVALVWAASHVPGLWGYYRAYPQGNGGGAFLRLDLGCVGHLLYQGD